jgi:dTDP-4-dehydrorhamnose 3,5-epimerase
MPFEFARLAIPDVILVEAKVFGDDRGFFGEVYKLSAFANNGMLPTFVQDNRSRSRRGVLRGLHYQLYPHAQAKLVFVTRGEIYDVAVDIRKGSPYYAQWVGAALSDRNHRALFVPEGFAHGFVALSEEADVVYKVSSEYSPEHECGILWNDPALTIAWPIKNPVLSPKDACLPRLAAAENNFEYAG